MGQPMLLEAGPQDFCTISALANEIWWEYYPSIVHDEQIAYMLEQRYSVEAIDSQFRAGEQFHLILRTGESHAIGYLSVRELGEGAYFLDKFYILAAHRGFGFGTAVLNTVIRSQPEIRVLRLFVNRKNFMAINFYFKFGFKILRSVDTTLDDRFVLDDFEMEYTV